MMRLPLRSLTQPVPLPATVRAAGEVIVPRSSPGRQPQGDPGAPTDIHIGLDAAGVSIGVHTGTCTAVPDLVPWAHLQGFSADHWTAGPDGSTTQILEIVSTDPRAGGTSAVRKFLVTAPDLVLFFRAIATWSELWSSHLPRNGSSSAGARGIAAIRASTRVPLVSCAACAAWVAWLAARVTSRLARYTPRLAGWVPGAMLSSAGTVWPNRREGTSRHGALVASVLVLAMVAGSATTTVARVVPKAAARVAGGAVPYPATYASPTPPELGNAIEAATAPKVISLPPASAPPAPAPPSLAGAAPLQPHEVFGYAPYWTLPESNGFDVQDLTTLAYFSVDANGNGTLDQSGPGWNGYESQDLADLVTRSHAAGDRVVLTVTCFDQQALDEITSDPNAAGRLSSALISAVAAKNLDGVNFDFEGQGSADQQGLTRLITQVSHSLHAANPHWQVTMAVYASSAGDPGGFYDVAALAPAVDGFFVMAYDMNDPSSPSATAPLVGGGYNDTEALEQFTSVVPASKVILGVPYYGYNWPTTNGTQGAASTGPETPLSYGTIAAANTPTYWDQATQTAWTSYQVGSQWYETYFDDPTSLALKADLANAFHIRGVGIWALGMDGNDPAMLAALLGRAPAVKDFSSGPTSTSTSPPVASSTTTSPSTTTSTTTPSPTTTTTTPSRTSPAGPSSTDYTYSGVWQGKTVSLTLASGRPVGTQVGTLGTFRTNDPALACLANGPPLDVWSSIGDPNTDYVTASQPADCADATWSFPVSGGGSGTSGSSSPGSTTTTTTSPNVLGVPLASHSTGDQVGIPVGSGGNTGS